MLFAMFLAASAPALAAHDPQVCMAPGERAEIHVSFSAFHENAVEIVNRRGDVVASFNNYFGRGAGSEWSAGSGGVFYAPARRNGSCYEVRAIHKNGPPNWRLAWEPSMSRTWGDTIGFEDSVDGDFNDATVRVVRTRELAWTPTPTYRPVAPPVRPTRHIRPGYVSYPRSRW